MKFNYYIKPIILSASLLTSINSHAQNFSVIKLPKLLEIMAPQSDTTYVINFWATWCMPCVMEFKNFQDISKKYAGEKVKVIFINLDFYKTYKKSLIPFLKARDVTEQVYLLNEHDYNSWIDKVDKNWDGEIPATLFINHAKDKKQFMARSFSANELEETIKPLISK
jgi:thiol-disulfide isomerase/thioredoxin